MEKKDSNTEQQILEAARKIFIRKGMSGARMQDIADEAGINKALLHYYYRSKEKLFEMVFREAAQKILISIKDIAEDDMPLDKKIVSICDRYLSELAKSPFLPLFILHEINQDPKRVINFFKESRMEDHLQKLFRQIQNEADKGNIRPVNPPHLMINIISLCVFPFAASPLLKAAFSLDQWQLKMFMEERKKQVPEFILAALYPAKKTGKTKSHKK
jgi:AcrR family transcriptional regulator